MLSRFALSARFAASRSTAATFRAASCLYSRVPYSSRKFKSSVTGREAVAMASTSPSPQQPFSTSTSTDSVAVVYCTTPSIAVARSLARHLVEEPQKLAACVNVVPGLTSIYSWKGKVEEDSEVLMIIKTKKGLLPALTEEIKAKHPYDEPEVLALPAIGGSESYLRWVVEETTTVKKDKGR